MLPGRFQSLVLSSYFSELGYSSFPDRLVFQQLEAVVDAVTAGQRGGEHEARLEHPRLTGLQMQGKNIGRIDEEIRPEIFPLWITRDLAQIGLQLVLAGAPGKIGVRLGKAELGESS